jgi:malonyl-CoA decarboxylase
MRQYMSVASAAVAGGDDAAAAAAAEGKEGYAAALYRMERGLRDVLRPRYSGFLEAMNAQPGGLKLLAVLRADLLALLG